MNWTEIIDATWPAARQIPCGPFTLREGLGGGSRVSAATCNSAFDAQDIDAAEAGMRELGQRPLFMIRPDETALDRTLANRGYSILDPVNAYACPATHLTDQPLPRVTVFSIWEPLEIMREIWAQAGIGPERLAVMDRVQGPKTGFLMRHRDKPGGAAFAAIHGDVAMVHAIEVLPHQQRNGLGQWVMRAAAFWALDNGAKTLSVLCTKRNTAANKLYKSVDMTVSGAYHYRVKEDDQP